MIQRKRGDLLSVEQGIIVHGCNARGVMGSGVAKQVKETYPAAYHEYLASGHRLGHISHYKVSENLIVVNAVTQADYGRNGERYVSYDAIDECFKRIRQLQCTIGIGEIHFPLIGAGLGGGDWYIISEIIDRSSGFEKYLWTL